jgi:Skp family chaperone for outer membrane proteins
MAKAPYISVISASIAVIAASVAVYSSIAVIAAGVAAYYGAFPPGSHSADEQTAQIAFVDFPRILKESAAGKSLNSQVEAKQKALKDEAEAKLKEFKREQEEIKAAKLSKEELDNKGKELQYDINKWNEESAERQADITNAANTAIKGIQEVVRNESSAIAVESNLAAVLPYEQAFYAQQGLDLTPEIMQRLDKKLKKVDIQFSDTK